MEAYPGAPQVIQGQPVYQAIAKTNVMPQMQQPIQSNASLPNVIASGYQYTHAGNIVNCSGLNQTSYILQRVDNSNKVVLCIRNPACTNNALRVNHVPENNEGDQVQNIQITRQVLNNTGMGANTAQKILQNPNLINPPNKGLTIPEPIHVDLNTHVSEKVGSLKIHVSESFLPWNITHKTVLDLDFMRHLFSISSVDVILTDPQENEKALGIAVRQLLHSKVLSDWLVLKCEEKEIPFLKVSSQVEIYTARNFAALLNVVTQESCLPLPFITEEDNYIKYLYLNFPKTGNDKVKKLSLPVFYMGENGKKKLPCKYPGIRMDCEFERPVDSFTIHVHESAMPMYQTSLSEIRQHLIYRHIIWGFLQMWIRLVKDQYNKCFKFHEIAKSLSLFKGEVSLNEKTQGNDDALIYDIGYSNCYLKFDPVALRGTKASFSVDNFSTNTVCSLSIVQYYKQFCLVNDMHYSDALRNTILFFQSCYYDKIAKPDDYVGMPTSLRSVRILPKNSLQEVYLNNIQKNVNFANLLVSASDVLSSQTSEDESDDSDIIEIEPEETPIPSASAKPLLKTRTVEEINSSVDAVVATGMNNNKSKSSSSNNNNVDDNDGDDEGEDDDDDNPNVSNVCQITHAAQKEGTRLLDYKGFVSLIQKFVENCYKSNNIEISADDESNEMHVIRRRFDEAVRGAINEETLESFIGSIFSHLQLYYTNATCQNILNRLIWRAVEAKYPYLKEEVSIKVVKSLRKSLVSNTDPIDKNTPSSNLESNHQSNLPAIGNNENSCHTDATTLFVSLQSESANSDTDGGVNHSGENDKDVITVSEERDVHPEEAPSLDVIPKKVKKQKSPIPSKKGERKKRNIRRSSSRSRSRSKKSKKHDKKGRSKKDGKDIPYRNTLTFVRVSDSPATFRISRKSRINSPNQSSEDEESESCDTPENHPTEESNEISDTDQPPQEEDKSVQTDRAPDEEEKSVQTDPLPEEEEKCVQTDDVPWEQDRYVQTDQLPQEQDRAVQTDDVVEQADKVDKECPREREYSKYNLKTCSVVLNPKDVQIYIGKDRKRKRVEEESDVESECEPLEKKRRYPDESDEDDYPRERKRLRRTVSEVQYMEARTRVLQRLRKRKTVYASYERTTISGIGLDTFLVNGSSSSRLNIGRKEEENEEERRNENEEERRNENEEERRNENEEERRNENEEDRRNENEEDRRSENEEDRRDESEEELEDEDEIDDDDESHWREMKKRYGIKEVQVVVTRLEETPEYEKYCLRLLRIEGWNPALEYLTRENFPLNRALQRKYFQLRDGKLYLKKNYQIINGVIVPADKVEENVPLSPKREPESPTREIDFDIDRVKSESE